MRRSVKTFFVSSVLISLCFITYSLHKLSEIKNDYNMHVQNYLEEEVILPKAERNEWVPPLGEPFYTGSIASVSKKIDWHDYKFIEYEKTRTGVGENGAAFELYHMNKRMEDELFLQNGFNGVLSDKISLNRSLPDIRHENCQKKLYSAALPNVSVVVPFYNEHWSTLLRTCYSVINRSPEELLVEIILVDDHSKKEFLSTTLDNYVQKYLPKVKIVRLPERSGLITARLAGAKVATGEVLIFLDSHTECNVNWLPPLLDPIAENYKYCVCPFIDVVDYDTFEYRAQDEGARGSFDWYFYYKRLPLLPESLANPSEIFESPVMAGGLFAISTKFFWEIGGYDEGLDIWGGEQYELSFKIWQCGGKMYDAPCSRIGHIYRGYSPSDDPRDTDFLTKNYKRVAEVWMDEYKEYLYIRDEDRYKDVDPGDLTAQKAIRDKLQCKPFKWFMENVAFDQEKHYPKIEPTALAYGAIRSLSDPELCIDKMNRDETEPLGLFKCAGNLEKPQENQYWVWSWRNEVKVRTDESCWDVSGDTEEAPVLRDSCHHYGGNQYWTYDYKKKWLMFGKSQRRCLDYNSETEDVFVNDCDEKNPNMRWEWGHLNKN